jgi:hypothetical protein
MDSLIEQSVSGIIKSQNPQVPIAIQDAKIF